MLLKKYVAHLLFWVSIFASLCSLFLWFCPDRLHAYISLVDSYICLSYVLFPYLRDHLTIFFFSLTLCHFSSL